MNKNDKLSSFQRDEALVITDYSNKYAEWPHIANSNNTGKTIQFSPTPSLSNVDTYSMSNSSSPNVDNTMHERRTSITSSSPSILKKKLSSPNVNNEIEPNTPPVPAVAPIPPGKSPIQSVKKVAATKRRDSKTIKRIPSESDLASVTGSPSIVSKEEDINIIHVSANPFDAILFKAEGFLKNVKETIKKTASSPDSVSHSASPYPLSKSFDTSKELDGNPHQRLFSFPDMNNADGLYSTLLIGTKVDPGPNLTQVDWLIRGVPEVYEEDFEIDDEAVDKLLKEGGNPPSQLVFPSYHAASQRKMSKFKDARFLYINLTHFLIYSARYGVRRDCSHIAIRPPLGCTLPANQLTSALISLTELDPNKEERKRKKSLLGDYFVGDCTMDENVKFPIQLDDSVISKWMDGKEEGCLRIELYSYMVSPHSHARQSLSANPTCFGHVNIPLAGLLCTETLDAVVNCDIHVEADTHASVLSRMRSMPYSNSVDFSKPLGMKMGSLSLRLSVLSTVEDSSVAKKVTDIISPLLIPQYDETNPHPIEKANEEKNNERNVIDSALAYHPEEVPIGKQSTIKDESSAFLGTVIYEAQFNVSYDLQNIIVSFKISKEIREEMSLQNIVNKSQYEVRVSQIYRLQSWKLPAFEVWVSLNKEKILLGLVRFDMDISYGDIISVPVICIKTTNIIGYIVMSLHMYETKNKVDDNIVATIMKKRQQQTSYKQVETNEIMDLSPPTVSIEPTHHKKEDQLKLGEMQSMYISVDTNVSIDSLTIDDKKETAAGSSSIFDLSDEAKVQYHKIIAEIDDDDSCINSKLEDMEAMLKLVADRINDTSSSSLLLDKEEELLAMADNILQEDVSGKIEDVEKSTAPYVQRNEMLGSSSSRLLDVIVEGTSDLLDNSETCLGFYVIYSLPSLFGNNPSTTVSLVSEAVQCDHKLWWDNNCAVLNTSNRHKFDLPNDSIYNANHNELITFYIVTCDEEDKLSTNSRTVGTATMPADELINMLSSGSIGRLFDLEIVATSPSTTSRRLKLNISHRIEPTLLRSSTSKLVSEHVQFESTTQPVQPSNALNNKIDLEDIRKDRQGFIVTIEEVSNLPSDTFSKDSLLLLTGAAGFTNLVSGTNNSIGTYIPGAEAFITTSQKAGKNVSWNESQEIWIHKPDSLTSVALSDNKCRWLRDATLLISLHIRQSWPLPYMYDAPSGFERPFATDNDSSSILKVGDQTIGSSAIDLSPFSFGMPCIDGWYHIVDHLQQQKGQIKISINLIEPVLKTISPTDTITDNSIYDEEVIEQPSLAVATYVSELLNSDGDNDSNDSQPVSNPITFEVLQEEARISNEEARTSTIFSRESVANDEANDEAHDEAKISFDVRHHSQQEFAESKSYLYEDESKSYLSSSSSSSSSSSPISYTHDDDDYDNRDDSNVEDKTALFVEPLNYNYSFDSNNIISDADAAEKVEYNDDDIYDEYEGNVDMDEDYIDDFEEDDDSSYNDVDDGADNVEQDDKAYDDYVVVDDVDNEADNIYDNDNTESLYSVKDDHISPPSPSSSSLEHGTMMSDSSSELLVANESLLSDESSPSIEMTRRNDASYTKSTLNDSSIASVKKQSLIDDSINIHDIIDTLHAQDDVADDDNDDVADDDNDDVADDDNDDVEMESLNEFSMSNSSTTTKIDSGYYVSEQSLTYVDDSGQPTLPDPVEVSAYDDNDNQHSSSSSSSSIGYDSKLNLSVDRESISVNDQSNINNVENEYSNDDNNDAEYNNYSYDNKNDDNVGINYSLDHHDSLQDDSLLLINTSINVSLADVDSPLTSKIRRVVDQEISKIAVIPQSYNKNDGIDSNVNNEDNSLYENHTNPSDDIVMINDVETSASTDIKEIIEEKNDEGDDYSHSIISKVASIAELIATNINSSSSNRRPGRQRQFIDAETERVSKIMLSKFIKK